MAKFHQYIVLLSELQPDLLTVPQSTWANQSQEAVGRRWYFLVIFFAASSESKDVEFDDLCVNERLLSSSASHLISFHFVLLSFIPRHQRRLCRCVLLEKIQVLAYEVNQTDQDSCTFLSTSEIDLCRFKIKAMVSQVQDFSAMCTSLIKYMLF